MRFPINGLHRCAVLCCALSEVVIEQHWRGKVKRTVCELFWEEVAKVPKKSEVTAKRTAVRLLHQHHTVPLTSLGSPSNRDSQIQPHQRLPFRALFFIHTGARVPAVASSGIAAPDYRCPFTVFL